MSLLVVDYLRAGGTYETLLVEHGVHAKPHNGKVSFIYDQISARDDDPIAKQCRGLILREGSLDVVAYPFDRFFNLGQAAAAAIDWGTARFEDKLDGTLLIVYWDDAARRWHCATRSMCEAHGNINGQGTFAQLADAAAHAESGAVSLDGLMRSVGADRGVTYMFELTGPYNRVVCEYGGLGLTLLGARRLADCAELDPVWICGETGFSPVKTWSFESIADLTEVITTWSPLEREGVVVKDALFSRIKVKSPQYVAAHKAADTLGSSWRNVCEAILTGHADDIIACVPVHVRERIENLRPAIAALVQRVEADYAELRSIDDMKTFALAAQQRVWSSPLFALKRGKAESVSTFMRDVQADTVLDRCRAMGWREPEAVLFDEALWEADR